MNIVIFPPAFRHQALLCAALMVLLSAVSTGQERQPTLDPEGQLERLEQLSREGHESESNQKGGEDVRGREEWFTFQRRYPYDLIPAGARIAAIREMHAMQSRRDNGKGERRGLLAASRWESIGPGNISGRVRAIAVHPNDPRTVFIGAAAGGVWKTTDLGDTWTTTFDTLPGLAMGALAIDPINPDIIYAGTGENTGNIDAYLGHGIFRSTDGGITWKNLPELRDVGAFSKLHVHKTNPNILYAAAAKASAGFYRSEDQGMTWTRVIQGDLYDMVVNPANNDEVYISSRNFVRRSTDGGRTFTTINTGISNISGGVRISIAIAASEPTRIYALMARGGGSGGDHIGEIFVSENRGDNWQLKYTFPSTFFAAQGWYDNCLAVDPFDPNVVLAGGIDVYRTTDGGTNWENSTKGYSGGDVHVDQHILVFSSTTPGVVYLGNDGGMYYSADAGRGWTRMKGHLQITQYYAMQIDQTKPYRIYGGTQDNGTHGSYGSSGYVQDWNRILGGDGFHVVVDLSNPDIIYAEQYNGTPLYRINANQTSQRVRIDGQISSSATSGDIGYWSTPIAMSPADKRTLYSGRSKLWRTKNQGGSWEALTTGSSNKITAIGLSPFDSTRMMIGTVTGELRYSHNDGAQWTRSTGIPNRFVTSIVYDISNAGRVYATYSGFSTTTGHVFRSTDDGATFTDISSNLPNIPVNSIAIDPQNPDHLFIGTDIGVFASLNGGQFWMPFNDGMPLSPVADLKIHYNSRSLIAATHGRSTFRVSIDGIEQVPVLITPVGDETYATPGRIFAQWAGFSGPVKILITYDGGFSYHELANNVTASQDSLAIPAKRTTIARLRVVEISSNRFAESRDFTLTAPSIGSDQGKRGFIAEAIEIRRDQIWSTVRDSDSLYRLRLPLLVERQGLVRTGIPGRIRDLAYDAAADIFYALVTEPDLSAPKVYRMDTSGASLGQMTLPSEITTATGIAMQPAGLAIITGGAAPGLLVLDANGAIVSRSGALQGATGSDRRGLVWDGLGYVQGVVDADPSISFPSELQHIAATDPLRVRERTPVVLQSIRSLEFVGLTFDPTSADINKRTFWATDTAGIFYKFDREKVFSSSVDAPQGISGRAREVAIGSIVPNPAHGEATISFTVRSRKQVSVEVFDPSGTMVAKVFQGALEPGDHSVRLESRGLASGVYYVAVSAGAGERDVRPVVIMK